MDFKMKTLLFLKKKKQKDFCPIFSGGQCRRQRATGEKVLFFKKEPLSWTAS
jgi:hypothetical protein